MYGRKGKQIFSKTVRSSKLKWQRTLQINNAHLDRSRCCWQHLQEARLRSKRFRLISEQRKTEEGDFRFWPREKWNESQKKKEGGGGRGRKETFFPTPPRSFSCDIFRAVFNSRSSFFAQKRLLRRLARSDKKSFSFTVSWQKQIKLCVFFLRKGSYLKFRRFLFNHWCKAHKKN